jgi:hypothetical protein
MFISVCRKRPRSSSERTAHVASGSYKRAQLIERIGDQPRKADLARQRYGRLALLGGFAEASHPK